MGRKKRAKLKVRITEAQIRTRIRALLLEEVEKVKKKEKWGSDQKARISEFLAVLAYNGDIQIPALIQSIASAGTDPAAQKTALKTVGAQITNAMSSANPGSGLGNQVKNMENMIPKFLEKIDSGWEGQGTNAFGLFKSGLTGGQAMLGELTKLFKGGVIEHTGTANRDEVGVADAVLTGATTLKGKKVPRTGFSMKMESSPPTAQNSQANQVFMDKEGDIPAPVINTDAGDAKKIQGEVMRVAATALQASIGEEQPLVAGYQDAQGNTDISKIVKEIIDEEKTSDQFINSAWVTAGGAPPTVAVGGQARNTSFNGQKLKEMEGGDQLITLLNQIGAKYWQTLVTPEAIRKSLDNYVGHFGKGDFGENLFALKSKGGVGSLSRLVQDSDDDSAMTASKTAAGFKSIASAVEAKSAWRHLSRKLSKGL